MRPTCGVCVVLAQTHPASLQLVEGLNVKKKGTCAPMAPYHMMKYPHVLLICFYCAT